MGTHSTLGNPHPSPADYLLPCDEMLSLEGPIPGWGYRENWPERQTGHSQRPPLEKLVGGASPCMLWVPPGSPATLAPLSSAPSLFFFFFCPKPLGQARKSSASPFPSSPPLHHGSGGLPRTLLPSSSHSPPCACPPMRSVPGEKDCIICNVHLDGVLLLRRTRQGEGACTAGRRGFITRLLNLNLSPPRMGVLTAAEVTAPQKPLPPLDSPSPFRLQVWLLRTATGPYSSKCLALALLGAPTGRWGTPEQGLQCALEDTDLVARRV